jgi:hypothetical protein
MTKLICHFLSSKISKIDRYIILSDRKYNCNAYTQKQRDQKKEIKRIAVNRKINEL